MMSLEFFIDIILPAALRPWGQLSLKQKWVPGIFPGGERRPVRRAELITFMSRLFWNLGSSTFWNLLGLSRPVKGLLYLLRGNTNCDIVFHKALHTNTSDISCNYLVPVSEFTSVPCIHVGRVAQSVSRLTTGWTVRDRIPVGTRFSARTDRPWGPLSLL
jgi:hypothetical protein